jgi:long-subunit acyl-CoA synthetase (AMP-forming)
MNYRLPLSQFRHQVATHANEPWLHQPIDRVFHTLTWGEVDEQARRIAAGLRAQGYERGDRIALLSKNCSEWFIADVAIMMAGMVSVPIYSTAGDKTIEHVLSHSESKAIFVGKLDSVEAANASIPSDVLKIAFPYPSCTSDQAWTDWLANNEPLAEEAIAEFEAEDLMTIAYTSGSTGLPKGVALSFSNIGSSSYCSANNIEIKPGDRMMSYLPLAHITERAVVEWMAIYGNVQIFFTESLETFIADVRHARPSAFISVPRLWTKFQSQILASMPDKKLQFLLKVPFLGKRVAHKIREKLGLDQSRMFGSGSAPISPGILRWYERIGVEIAEGWGMTETSGLSCSSIPFDTRYVGTIGMPLSCVDMKLSDEGEVLIGGEAVFKYYYKNPEATAEAIKDGWFHTGDRGEINDLGCYRIIGRVKEQFKTSKGKYVAPVPIESMLGRNSDIDQVCVLGSGRKQPLAMVVLNEQHQGFSEDMQNNLEATLNEVNAELESHQRLDHLIVCNEFWTIENDMLTPTLKIKRNKLEDRYGDYLHRDLSGKVIWEGA